MSVRREITNHSGVYFITTTITHWFNLFEITQSYDSVYGWFDQLKSRGHFILGYVIMPNHLHSLIAFRETGGRSINSIVGNGKRFIAYEIVKRLETQKQEFLLKQLESFVSRSDQRRGKIHEVFEPSFDWKECVSEKFIRQKLEYMHNNPCTGKWHLVNEPTEYMHSSAQFYMTGRQGIYEVMSYTMLDDIDLTKALLA
jgi:REP element-mobilizing transposase RayT